ncbi:MAG: hypothetical protein Alpg2KO_06970 [Alphaproteobacteria bacterium]
MSKRTDIAPLEERLTGKGQARREVEAVRDQRDGPEQVEGVSDNALVRLSEISNRKMSLQTLAAGSAGLMRRGVRRALSPVTPSRAPSNTPWARLLRRISVRGSVDGLYRRDGSIIMAGTSPELLQLAVQRGHDMQDLDAWGVKLKTGNLAGGRFKGADFRDAVIGAVDLGRADLQGASFARSKILGWCKPGNRAWRHEAKRTTMRSANLAGADFRQSKLIGVDFAGADLSGADFSGTKFDDFSIFKDRADANMAMVMSAFVVTIPIFAAVGLYKDTMKRERYHTRFDGANLKGAKFSLNAPFETLGLSRAQLDEIVLVDRHGKRRDDLIVAEDGSLVLKDIGVEAPKRDALTASRAGADAAFKREM